MRWINRERIIPSFIVYYLPKTKISFPDKIYSISCSNKSNKIYACLDQRKAVAIFQYNLIKKTMNLCEEEIRGLTYNPHFNKCIELVDDYVATSEMDEINIILPGSISILLKEYYLYISIKTIF